jgi:putative redox protein
MSVHVTGRYLGNKRVELKHGPTGSTIITDAPKDNHGEGSTFSPTDLVAAALGACMLTVMSIVAERDGISLAGMTVEVTKQMADQPRRIGSLPVVIHMPKALSPEQRIKLERVARTCPVSHSLNPLIEAEIGFIYDA